MSDSRMIKGTLILSAAQFISKFLGLLFVIPLYAIVGTEGGVLYAFAYMPYSIILSIATVGVPLAVSKFVAKYNALGDYYTGRRLFRSGMVLMTITGILSFAFMYGFAPFLAAISSGGATPDVVQSSIHVMRVTSFALIIVPAMSLMRGYFQGFQSMGPTAASQTLEQIVRVVFGIVGAYMVMKFFNHSVATAVSFTTFGAFVGAVAGLYVLIHYWIKRKPYLDQMVEESKNIEDVSLIKMYKEIISYAIPFVCVGLSSPVYFLIDQVTVGHFMVLFHHASKTVMDVYLSDFLNYDQKIVLIPVSLAISLGLSVVPAITESFAEGHENDMQLKITQAFQFTLYFTLPAVVCLSILSYMVYGLLYGGFNHGLATGGMILRWYSPSAILFAGFTVTASILQGINRQKVTILSLGIGILIKLLFNPVFIKFFDMIGPILATDLGFLISILLNLWAIGYSTGYSFTFIAKRLLLISIFTVFMSIGLALILALTGGSIPHSRIHAFMVLVLGGLVGGGIYLLLSYKSGLLRQVLGNRFRQLQRFM